jgi:glyoxylase-like metal-dependent hydrolase (beta-lactamase superfamily II)
LPDAGIAKLKTKVFVSPSLTFENNISGTFSPTSSTLIIGERDAVLVDAQHLRSDVKALGDLIEQTGKRLTTIYVTHGHADHWYGIGELTRRFPTARAVATAGTLDYINKTKDYAAKQWRTMFGDRVVDANLLPEIVSGPLSLEGHELRIVEVGQGDIENSTVLHIPAIDAVIAGDVVYNKIHMMVGLGGPKEWALWLDSIDQIEKLKPKMIVAGHKKADMPDTHAQRIIDESRSYIQTFAEASEKAENERALTDAMTAKFPDFGNVSTLLFSAKQYLAKQQQQRLGRLPK